ncbi:MAG: nucleoside-diphosphate kinase [Rickettsiales bacterium]|jgi:nucleoside-diphosphate kinase|nr:nucleoside-diphosphate kinase [Rickettsiales bacterium]
MIEKTLSIIKPDAVERSLIGKINAIFEESGLKIAAQKMIYLTKYHARLFYMEHSEKVFFEELVDYMTSGPIVVQVLQGENAIHKNRALMGKTNPHEASIGTIRALFGESVQRNCVHGSDSIISVQREINFFFSEFETFNRYENQ